MKRNLKRPEQPKKAAQEDVLSGLEEANDSLLVALEQGPGTVVKKFGRTMEGIRLEVIISIYTEMIGQTARQSRNVEQIAPELARKSIICADELIKVLTDQSSAHH